MKNTENLSGLIKSVLAQQRFAVLATQSEGQPYCNLVAFAESDDLKILLYVTGRKTRKYANSLRNKKVAILIDNRTNQAADLRTAIAITALGTVEEATKDDEEKLLKIYLFKHPEFEEFLNMPQNALMRVTVSDYIVATFKEVRHLSIIKN